MERVKRFIMGLNFSIRYVMVREAKTNTTFHEVVEIGRCLERMLKRKEREELDSKRPCGSGSISSASSRGQGHRGRGRPFKLV